MKRLALAALIASAFLLPARADVRPPEVDYENQAYNGDYTFVRVRFTPSRWGPGNYRWGLDLKWNHDYPVADAHLARILQETTLLATNQGAGAILALDDPELFRHPVAYLCEPGFWTVSAAEARGLRDWLAKGGFLIVDDFVGWHWYNFEETLKQVLPDAEIVRLESDHPVFHAFFDVEPYEFRHPNFFVQPEYYGVFEDNDPAGRLMIVINYNHDVGDYWEWSDSGFIPIELSNEAYKLGVDYVLYGMSR